MSVRGLTCLVLALSVTASSAQTAQTSQSANRWRKTAPESFRANAQVTGTGGGVASGLTIQIDKYTSDADHAALVKALKEGGNGAFVSTLKTSPVVGKVTMGDRTFTIRWARQQIKGDSRRIAVATDSPVFFAGAGAVDAKPTAGFDIAVLEFTVDSIGLGKGSMAAAAHVKPGGPTGVQVDDYSGKRIDLVTVTRNSS
ncbi:MAG TPA: hypothetical protein VL484_06080 [Vicinamibacterales bacterium]|nr:hypothetical protein [Vicinamibacterales bacterium]